MPGAMGVFALSGAGGWRGPGGSRNHGRLACSGLAGARAGRNRFVGGRRKLAATGTGHAKWRDASAEVLRGQGEPRPFAGVGHRALGLAAELNGSEAPI